jgi:hypothetical protein
MAKIDTTKIEGYENMTPEEKLQVLEGYEYEDHSEELERMKSAVTKANGEAAEWKRKHKAQMTEEEQRKQEATEATERLMKELEELRRDKVVSQYKTSFMGLGYDEAAAAETAKAMADGDMAKVFATQQKFQENMAKKLRADALKDTPRPGSGTPGETDYGKMISDAQERGDNLAAAYYTRLQSQQDSHAE